MLYFLAALIPVQLVFFQFTSTLPLFLVHNFHFPESIYGTIFTVNTLLIVALEVPLNIRHGSLEPPPHSHARRVSLRRRIRILRARRASLRSARRRAFSPRLSIWTFGEMIMMPGSSAYAAEIAPPERRGEYMGLYTMSFNVGFSIGAVAGRKPSRSLGTECCVGSRLRLRLHFRADDEPHRARSQ